MESTAQFMGDKLVPALGAIVLGASSRMYLELRLLFDSSAHHHIHILSYGLNFEHSISHQLAISIDRTLLDHFESPNAESAAAKQHTPNTSSNCVLRALHYENDSSASVVHTVTRWVSEISKYGHSQVLETFDTQRF